jgi:hypothetical protein
MSTNYTVEDMKNALDKLVECMEKKGFKDDKYFFINEVVEKDDKVLDQELLTIYNEIVNIADTVLITPEGQAFFSNHRKLQTISSNHYSVVRGEFDSFGWLSGVIVTRKGRIVYG